MVFAWTTRIFCSGVVLGWQLSALLLVLLMLAISSSVQSQWNYFFKLKSIQVLSTTAKMLVVHKIITELYFKSSG